jgi:hypothetical protein
MNSLSVTYESSSNAWMTSDIFLIWFESEFVPSVTRNLRLKGLEEKTLLPDNCAAHSSADTRTLQSKDGKMRLILLPKNTTALIQTLDQGIIRAFEAYYHGGLLNEIGNSELQVTEFLKTVTFKNVAYSIGLAWDEVSPTSVENCWVECVGNEVTDATDNAATETVIPERDMTIASRVLETGLQQSDFEDFDKRRPRSSCCQSFN